MEGNMGIFDPLINLIIKGLSAKLDKEGEAKLFLHLFGDESKDEQTAELVDETIQGGLIIEGFDKQMALSLIKAGRQWANEILTHNPS
jgi:hypothetical protein